MRKVCAILGSAVALAAAASSAQAAVSLVIVPVTLTNATLSTNWTGYELKLVADAGQTVAGFDLTNGVTGITGNIHQRWTFNFDPDTGDPLPDNPSPTGNFPTNPAAFAGSDSFFGFNQSLLLSNPNQLTEDNDQANGSNPPYTRSPINDGALVSGGFDFGVGTSMTGSGVIASQNQPATLNLAFIIVPKGTAPSFNGVAHFQGVATDSNGGHTLIDQDIGGPVPEPASLGVLAMGTVALLAKRRKA